MIFPNEDIVELKILCSFADRLNFLLLYYNQVNKPKTH